MKTKEQNHSEQQAQAQYESIKEMIETLKKAQEADDTQEIENAIQRIQEDPLSLTVRSGWQELDQPLEPTEYCILLCTGGPAVRIVGELGIGGQPDSATIQHQDWGTPWTEYRDVDEDVLLEYAQQFYFGE